MPRRVLLLSVALAASASCLPSFDESSKTACRDQNDCVPGYTCVFSVEGRIGECAFSVSQGGGGQSDILTDIDSSSDTGADISNDTTESDVIATCVDSDNDGAFTSAECGPLDCDDGNASVFPNALEECNGVDDDCDGPVDEDFDLTTTNACGACNTRCEGGNAEWECDAGECTVIDCLPGSANSNGDSSDGCESPCASTEQTCGDGQDDDCDGFDDADDEDCATIDTPAADHYSLFVWEYDANLPNIRLGHLTLAENGLSAAVTSQTRTNLLLSGRGESLPDTNWTFSDVSETQMSVVGRDERFQLFGSPITPGDLWIGHDEDTESFYVLVAKTETRPDVNREWLAWVVSPLNEFADVPGGSATLGWGDPTEIALLRFGPSDTQGRGGVIWPFSEYRDQTVGDVDGTTSLGALSYTVGEDGDFAMELLGSGGADDINAAFDGAAVPSGDFFIGPLRRSMDNCDGRWSTAEQCVHDPILAFGIDRADDAGSDAMVGDWRIIGLAYDAQGSGDIGTDSLEGGFRVSEAGDITGDFGGTVGIFGSSDTFLPPTTRIDLSTDAGTVVLEGHVTPNGYGVFWDQSGQTSRRPMHGGFFLVVRQ